MEIPNAARKCPYCQHFQNCWVILTHHPALPVLSLVMPWIAILVMLVRFFAPGENFEDHKAKVVISEAQLAFGETKSGKTVDVIGMITNGSSFSWKEPELHVDFLNASGKRVDVGHKANYFTHLQANGSSSFKLSFPMEFPETNYAKPVVTVVTARDASSRF